MLRDISLFSKTQYDVLIVGGGINGAAIANVAAANGLKVALLEKGDFASGTSSKSTKLIHGGIRYLERFEFDLVRESLKERYIQLKSVPYLVKPLGFIIPVYKTDRRPLWMIQLGVWLYDFLSGKYKIGSHQFLTKETVSKFVPAINTQDLIGGVTYYDVQMDDARLCLENVLMATRRGAHVANYVEVNGFIQEQGKVVGVRSRDILGQQTVVVRAKHVVCAGGPWTNRLLKLTDAAQPDKIRLTKGIHIIYRGQTAREALLITSQQDQRIFFIIPWMGNSLIGTTDTDYRGDPDHLEVEPQDIQYLLTQARRVLPGMDFKESNIITTFAGLRPLLNAPGAPSDLSRKHSIEKTPSGVWVVIGGKYTTYRKIAEDCVKRFIPVKTDDQYPLYGSGMIKEKTADIAAQSGIAAATMEYLMNKYGTRYQDVVALTQKNPELKKPICSCSPAIAAQIVYAVETEMAQTKEDIIERRLGLKYLDCPTKACEKNIEKLMTLSFSNS